MKLNFSIVLLFCLVCLSLIVKGERCDKEYTERMGGILTGNYKKRKNVANFCYFKDKGWEGNKKQKDKDCYYESKSGYIEMACTGLTYCNCKFPKYCCN